MAEDRFWSKVVDAPNGCKLWTAALNDAGYGVFQMGRGVGTVLAHRYAWHERYGVWPVELDHTCHSEDETCPGGVSCPHRACVFVEHLEDVSRQENQLRGLGPPGRNRRKERCSKGHSFAEDGYVNVHGHRVCRICKAEKRREWRRKVKARG
jgi:hypothetical protein